MIRAALLWLRRHHELVNALNVFPVPDGDTGTNMLLTMEAAWQEIAGMPDHEVGALLQRVARGALMGARGNSGVILSQIWRGMAQVIDHRPTITAEDLALALQEAARTAYRGVMKPVEGTILTVIREASEEAIGAVQRGGDLMEVMEQVVRRAREAVRRTPDLLPVLKAAGVVDSGGQGLYLILEGMLRCLKGEPVEEEIPMTARSSPGARATEALEPGAEGYGYDVQFILVGRHLDVDQIRRDLEAMGDSVLVVGDANTVKVHLHVHDPGQPLSYAIRWGSLRDVVVEDMQAQYEQFIQERARSAESAPPPLQPGQIATIAVVPSEGWGRIFISLGASATLRGGQTMNPSTQQFVELLQGLPTDQIIVLPNNPNVVLTARQAAELVSDKRVEILPTHTLPQGVAAMVAYRAEAGLESNLQAMKEALHRVRSGEITRATRDVELAGVAARQGQWIGLVEDRLVAAGDDLEEVVQWTFEAMDADSAELLTLYVGADADPSQTARLIERLRSRYPQQQIEVVEAGQPYYPYILSAE
ncbi:MAG: DAK2 domain-containing protein [Anaerolineae bacterium]|uniref:DAK2 domain-containing protein n=1 Tax=Thermoflexus sp. TaxID=1969742 RepID=UPI0025D9413D|nr:DAK2 domain-containing protein [Thermoflexus sp.]MCS7351361.1 DAK2 domain-containing protein [Thermoflexus sp.]MDW8180816.1 DAK2 domain-containing protein [Anaerolineae bacterium]